MEDTYIKLLNEVFSDPSNLSLDGLKVFVSETVKCFSELKDKITSNDPALKEEALNFSMEVKKALEGKMDTLCKLTGMDPSMLGLMSENPDNLGQEEYKAVQEAKKELGALLGTGDGSGHKSKTRLMV